MMSKKTTQYTPQSSLGELGQSLLKFLTPVRRVKAHTQQKDYLDEATQPETTVAATAPLLPGQTAPASDKNASAASPSAPSSGVIKVSREGTPWISMVTNLMTACDQGSAHARGYLGSNAYQNAQENRAELRRKTVGRIVNIVTEDDGSEGSEAAQAAGEQQAQGSKEKGDKVVDHFNVASQQNVLKKPA